MDIVSHGLWGGVAAGRASKKNYKLAFLFGVLPDLISFVPQFVYMVLSPEAAHFKGGPPDPATILPLTYALYNITHSLVIFSILFALVWFVRQKPLIPLLAWGLHILCDIPTHSVEFFPTPFLWPLADVKVNGFSWGQGWFMILNYSLLILVYAGVWISRRRVAKNGK